MEDLKRILKSQSESNIRAAAQVRVLEIEQELKFGFWEEMIWRDLPKRNVLARKIELDTRLQVELGKVLVFYLTEKAISLKTIAHLILLAYWAGGLSEVSVVPEKPSQEEDKGSTTPTETFISTRAIYTKRALRVRNIYDNLREVGLHKSAVFKGEAYTKFMAKLEQAKRIVGPTASGLRILYLLYLSDVATRSGLTQQEIEGLISSAAEPSE